MGVKGRAGLMRNALKLYVLAILLPLLLFAAWLCGLTVREHYERTVEDGWSLLRVTRNSVLTNASLVENLLDMLAYDADVQRLLSNGNMSDYERVILQIYDVRATLSTAATYLKDLDGSITLFSANDRMPESFWYALHMDRIEDAADFAAFQDSGSTSAWVGLAPLHPQSTVLRSEDNMDAYTYYRWVMEGTRRIGALKCGVSPEQLFSPVRMNAGDAALYVARDGAAILQTGDGALPDYDAAQSGQRVERVGRRLLLVCPLDGLGADLLLELDYGAILFRGWLNGLPQLMILLLSSAFLFWMIRRYLRAIQVRLDEAVVIGERAKAGQMDIAFPKLRNDEISQLVGAFNVLLGRLQAQAQQQIASERAQRRILQLALQYQMNPHFLFNTLNWLQMSVEMGVDKETLSDGIVLLGKLLRYNLNSDAYSILREELESTNNYVRLMNMCKRGSICFEMDLQGIDAGERIIRFLFQPLCENAIQHGMIPQRPLTIRLRGWREGSDLCFAVENDGKPVDPDAIPRLLDGHGAIHSGRGVGLSNIAARIDLLYAKGSGISIRVEDGWTRVLLRLCINGGDDGVAASADR